jgi:Domain of unknown function (DUF222)/HNH endonuclease
MGSAVAVLEEVVADLEPGTLDVSGAKKLVDLFTRAERLSVAGRGLAARRVQDGVSWKRDGHRSAAHWLAASTGVSVGAAARSLQMARELEALPDTAEAFRAGELSEAQAGEIAAAATQDPSAEARLLDTARSSSYRGLRDSCREASVRAEQDAACARRLHEGRAAYAWTDRDGCYRLNVSLAPDEGARLNSALQTTTDEIFHAARRAGNREPRAAYMADAIMALLAHGPAKPIEVRLDADHAVIQRGYVEPGERCEIAGIGPIPVTIARALLNDARITVLGREGTKITTISSPTRTIPAKLRRWLERTYPVCGAEGCDCSERLEIDHIVPVEEHGPSDEINCWRLCPHHHKLKTYYGWKVEGPVGARRLVPPHDPDPP